MKKMIAFLLAFMMIMGVLFIFVSAEEATNQEGASCSCGGSYGAWTYPDDGVCQGGRYSRICIGCGKVQTAKDITPKTISYTVPAIGANIGDTVMLSLYDVYFTSSKVVSNDNIVWSSSDIEIVNNCVYPTEVGVYELIATSGSSTKSVYLVTKKPTDTEYVLFFDNFNRDPNGDGNTNEKVNVPANADATKDDYAIVQQPSGTSAYFQDGKLVLDTLGNASNQMRVLLPKWIGVFGDYKIDTVFTINSTVGNDQSRWFATMARVGNSSSFFPIWQAAVRKGAMSYYSGGNKGIEISYTKNGTNWTVPYFTKYTENIDGSKYYTQTFNIVGTEASHALNGTVLLDTRNFVGKDKPASTVGYVGFHLRASLVYVDSIKIVVPIDDSIHNFGNWETVTADTCTSDGLERRTCTNCDVTEEQIIKGGHKIVSYALKAPSCTESGYLAYEACERCDYTTFSGAYGPFGHYFDREIKSIAHRGYSSTAPENTLPAYILAKEKGFAYAECDVAFTKDGVAVLLHDATIDRTSNGSGNIADLTYEELLQYDFGSWKSSKYAGTKIPTFEEFIALCKENGLHPYIEIKNDATYTQDQVSTLVEIVEKYGLEDNCTWISFNITYLEYVMNVDDTARLGYVSSKNITQSLINPVLALRTGKNEVFLDISYNMLNETNVMLAIANGIALETWTVDNTNDIKNRPKYVSGYTSNKLVAEDYLVKTAVTAPTCGAQGYTTYTCFCGATKVDDYVPATGNHTAKDGVCTECNAIVYCSDASHNLEIISISYANGYDKEGVKVVRCLDCDAAETEAVANPLVACLGYSTPQDGRAGVAVSFKVDNSALNEYEAVTKKSISYGAFAVSQDNIKSNEIFDENGSLQNGVILADIANYKFNLFDIVIVGFDADHMNSLFAMGAYVAVTENDKTEYSYIQNEAPLENAVYSFESYNSILSKMEGVE